MPSARRDMRAALQSRVVLGDRPQLIETPGEHAMPGARLIAVGRIVPNPHQPRKRFDPHTLDELAASVRERGILQPLVVRPAGDGYAIVMGERRYRAALLVGLETVPVVVREITDEQAYLDALIENLQREDLTDEEEAEAYRGLVARGLSVRKIAESLGIAASKVSRMVRIYGDETLSAAVIAGQITKSQAQEMLAVSPEGRIRLVQFVTDRRENGVPVSLPELRNEVEGIQRPSVALRNTQAAEVAETPQLSVALRNTQIPEAGEEKHPASVALRNTQALEAGGIQRLGVALRNTQTSQIKGEGHQQSVALRNTQAPAMAPQPFLMPDFAEPTTHDRQSVMDARQLARALRQTIEAQLPLLLAFMQDPEVLTELQTIHRIIGDASDAV